MNCDSGPQIFTLLDELPPSLGPGSQLVPVSLFYLGTFLQAAHEIVAQPMAVVKPLDDALVVPHLRTETPNSLKRQKATLAFTCSSELARSKTSPNIHDS